MLKQLLAKWFDLDISCQTCEVLKMQLATEQQFNKVLFDKLMENRLAESTPIQEHEYKPLKPNFVPWRVRQQMLEAEDKAAAKLIAERKKQQAESLALEKSEESIEKLEKEVGIA